VSLLKTFTVFCCVLSLAFAGYAQTCPYPIITAELITGIWGEEISWGIINENGTQAAGAFTGFEDNSTYSQELCLEPGCYTVWMADSYGDGWQGAVLSIEDEQGDILCSGQVPTTPGDYAIMSLPIQVECPVTGCTMPDALNYNPEANIDDGTCVQASDNTTLFGHWQADDLPINSLGGSYNDVEGLEVNGVEYAIVGSNMGTHIIDVSTSTLIEVQFLEGAYSSGGVTHRDYHIDGSILFAVCDQGSSTLQIFDLSSLPFSVTTLYDDDEFSITSHNVFVDNDSDLLYLCSNDSPTSSTPVRVLDVHDPTAPSELVELSPWISGCHDIFVENDTAWINSGSAGLFVMHIDASPTMLGHLTGYPFQGGNHSGWWMPEDEIFVMADETHGAPLHVVDASDLSDMEVISTLSSGTDPGCIPHNLMIRDDLVFVSYYHDGLQVFDISDPNNPNLVAWYDTFVQSNYSGYKGAWGVHSALPSGKILITDVSNGLFVIELDPEILELCPGEGTVWNQQTIDTEGYYLAEGVDDNWGSDILWLWTTITEEACPECIWDLDGNGSLGVSDLTIILAAFGCLDTCEIDFNDDSATTISDLLFLLSLFGTDC
jgi:choice-of-anchor B domain-containing protein